MRFVRFSPFRPASPVPRRRFAAHLKSGCCCCCCSWERASFWVCCAGDDGVTSTRQRIKAHKTKRCSLFLLPFFLSCGPNYSTCLKFLNPKNVLNFFLEEETKNWAPFSHVCDFTVLLLLLLLLRALKSPKKKDDDDLLNGQTALVLLLHDGRNVTDAKAELAGAMTTPTRGGGQKARARRGRRRRRRRGRILIVATRDGSSEYF